MQKKFLLLILIITSGQQYVMAQQNATTGNSDVPMLTLPPMMDLIDSALKKNASVHYRDLEVELRATNLQSEKIYWTRNLGVQADTRYGTFDNFSTSSSSQSTTVLNSTNRQLNYGIGVYVKMPLGDILNRKNQVKRAAIEYEEAKQLSLAQQDERRQAVIKLFQDVLLRHKLLLIKSEALGNARVNAEMVEKEFRNGIIPVSEYVRISDIVSRAEADYEIAKTEFSAVTLLLENITGIIFNRQQR